MGALRLDVLIIELILKSDWRDHLMVCDFSFMHRKNVHIENWGNTFEHLPETRILAEVLYMSSHYSKKWLKWLKARHLISLFRWENLN